MLKQEELHSPYRKCRSGASFAFQCMKNQAECEQGYLILDQHTMLLCITDY